MTSTGEAAASGSFQGKLRRLAIKVFILVATVVVCLLLAEAATRLLFPQFNPNVQLRFRVMPDGFALGPAGQAQRHATPKGDFNVEEKFNRYGFRDERDLKDSTDADWFAVGDSYTMGWGVDEDKRYSDRLEQKLRAANDPARVFNIGIPGNLVDYGRLVKYAESHGAKIRHLVIGVCMDNDLEDYAAGKSDWAAPATTGLVEGSRRWFRSHSALYLMTSFVVQRSALSRRVMEKLGVASDVDVAFGDSQHQPDETVLRSSRDELVRLATGRDVVVLLIPSRRLWYGTDPAADRRTHEAFARLCREAGLRVVDMEPAFDRSSRPAEFYFVTDPHWSVRGHEAAAEELFHAIKGG